MASKRGPLSKAEVFYITEHAKSGKNIDEIALDLDRPIKSVQSCYTKAQKEANTTFNVGQQFAKHKGSVVMTQNASELSDATRHIRTTKKTQDCITSAKKD